MKAEDCAGRGIAPGAARYPFVLQPPARCPSRSPTAIVTVHVPRSISFRARRVLALLAVLLNLVGCGLFGPRETPAPPPAPAPMARPAPPAAPAASDDSAMLRGHLQQHYRLWKGTPYRMGGLTTRGIDCSGFVLVTFKALLNTRLPRTVEEQATLGRGIVADQLRTGDLVFFKTGSAMRHVGIYLDHGQFMHASTRRGVMISALSDGYWRQRFWQARRVREPRQQRIGDNPPKQP